MDELNHIIQEILGSYNRNPFSNLYFLLRDDFPEYRNLHKDVFNKMSELGYLQNKIEEPIKLSRKGYLATIQANKIMATNDSIEKVRLRKKKRQYISPIIDYFVELIHEGIFSKDILERISQIEFEPALINEYSSLLFSEFPKFLTKKFDDSYLFEFANLDLVEKKVSLWETKLSWEPVYEFDMVKIPIFSIRYIELPFGKLAALKGINEETFQKIKEIHFQKRQNYFTQKKIVQKEYANYTAPDPVSLIGNFKNNKDAKYVKDIILHTNKYIISDIRQPSWGSNDKILDFVIEPIHESTKPKISFFCIDGAIEESKLLFNNISNNIRAYIGKPIDVISYQIIYNPCEFFDKFPDDQYIFYNEFDVIIESELFKLINDHLDSYLMRQGYIVKKPYFGDFDNLYEIDWSRYDSIF